MITFTQQEYFQFSGEDLSEILPKTPHSDQADIFINFVCKEIDRYIKRRNIRLFKNGYDDLSEFQTEKIKEACLTHAMDRLMVGKTYYDEATKLPKTIPVSDTVKDILMPLIYRGVS